MKYIIQMESETFGTDVFHYYNKDAMQAGLLRLVDAALKWSRKDGIGRSFIIVEEASK